MFKSGNLIFILVIGLIINLFGMQSDKNSLTKQKIKEVSKLIVCKNNLLTTLANIEKVDSSLIKDKTFEEVRLFLQTKTFEESFCKLLRKLDTNDSSKINNFEEISSNSLWEIIVAREAIRMLLEQKAIPITHFNPESQARQLQKSGSSGSSQSSGSYGSFGEYFWGPCESQASQASDISLPIEHVFFPSSSQSSHMFDNI